MTPVDFFELVKDEAIIMDRTSAVLLMGSLLLRVLPYPPRVFLRSALL